MSSLEVQHVSRRAVLGIVLRFVVVAPFQLFVTVFLRLVNAAFFAFAAIIVAGFTNALINGERVFFWCCMYLVMSGCQILTDVLNYPTQLWFSNRAILYFQQRLLKQAARIPMLHFFDAEFHDVSSRAHRDFGDRIVRLLRSVLDNIHCVATLVGLFAAVFIIGGGIWCAAALLLSTVVISLTQPRVISLRRDHERSVVRSQRIQETWAELLASRTSAGEIRLFTLQRWLLAKWEKSYQTVANLELATLKKIMRWEVLAGFSTVFGYAAVLFIAAHAAQSADPKETAGIFTGLIHAAVSLQGFLSTMVRSLGSLAEQVGILRELAILFSIQPDNVEQPAISNSNPDSNISAHGSAEPLRLQMEGISFRYPQTGTDVLKHITAEISPGERIALVGKNGSGKTTLANILLGLYPPSRGSVKIDAGTAQKTVEASAVFQDFVRYLLPVRDNVAFSDVKRIQDDAGIRSALLKAGSTFSQDLDLYLGNEFGGRDISGGEWLRIAVARGLFRDSPLMVFDEPTASIDPVAEADIIRELLTKAESRTLLVISHRLGVARLCDRILVLDEGALVESGTHAELLANEGIYAEMWRAQSAWYA